MLRRNTFENKNYICLTWFLNSRRWLWIAAAFFCLLPAIASGVEVTLRWNPSFSPAVVGYNVYYGPDPENYGDPIDAGNAPELLISGLEENTAYHFAVTAYNSDYIESVLSKELTYRKIIPSDPGTITGNVSRPADTDLDPAADIAVCALDYDLGHWMGCTRSLSDGSYAISGLPSGSYRVRVLSEDTEYAGEYYQDTFEYSAAEQVAVVEGTATEDIDFVRSMGGVISGRTLDLKGSPIGRLLIYLNMCILQKLKLTVLMPCGVCLPAIIGFGQKPWNRIIFENIFIMSTTMKTPPWFRPRLAGRHRTSILFLRRGVVLPAW